MNKERLKQDFYEAVNEEWQKTAKSLQINQLQAVSKI